MFDQVKVMRGARCDDSIATAVICQFKKVVLEGDMDDLQFHHLNRDQSDGAASAIYEDILSLSYWVIQLA